VNDVLCGVLVYAYVFAVIFIVERLWKGDQAVGRKILHMSMGNIVFLLWLLTSPWTALIIAGSFLSWKSIRPAAGATVRPQAR